MLSKLRESLIYLLHELRLPTLYLVLVLGLCFFAGGVRFSEQGFDASEASIDSDYENILMHFSFLIAATQVHSSLLSLSVGALLLPAAYHFTLGNAAAEGSETQTDAILHMSHAVSVAFTTIYPLSNLYFSGVDCSTAQ